MAPGSKADKKATVDAAAWMFNVVTSVGIIIVNKALMATYGFSFGNNPQTPFDLISLSSCLYFTFSIHCSNNLDRSTFRHDHTDDTCSKMSRLHSAFSSSLHRAS